MVEVVVTTGAISRAKLQSDRHHQQTNTRFFTGRMPFLSSTNSINQQYQSTEGKTHPYVIGGVKRACSQNGSMHQ